MCGLNSTVPDYVSSAYDNDINKIDLWVGVITEPNLRNSHIGPLGNCILKKQFENLRDGDRFFYKRVFSDDEIAELRKLTLSKIICEHSDGIRKVPKDVFVVGSEMVNCEDMAEIDYSVFFGDCR